MGKPDGRHTPPAAPRKTPGKRGYLETVRAAYAVLYPKDEAGLVLLDRLAAYAKRYPDDAAGSVVLDRLAAYAVLHPQDEAGRVVLARLAADPDGRVSGAFAAILPPDDPGTWLIFAILQAASLARDHASLPLLRESVARDCAQVRAALDIIADWLGGFGEVQMPPPGVLTTDSARAEATLILESRELLPRLQALAAGVACASDGAFAALPLSRKRRAADAPTLAALRALIAAIRAKSVALRRLSGAVAKCGAPHERHAAGLIEAACDIEEIPDNRVRHAARKARIRADDVRIRG